MGGHRRRPWHTPPWHAAICFGFGCVLVAIDFPPVSSEAWLPDPPWARLLVLACMCLLQLARESRPVPALLAGLPLLGLDVAMGLGLPALLVAGDHLYTAVLHGPRRASRFITWLTGAFVVVTLVVFLTVTADLRVSLLVVLQVCSLPLVPVWWATNVRQQREIAEAERARADHLARIAELDRAAAVHAERTAMARDLHDVIAGHVSAAAIQSEALLAGRGGDPERARAVLRSVRENSVAALTEMRAMIGLLRAGPDAPADAFTSPARLRELDALVRSARAAGLVVRLDVGAVPDLPAAVDQSAYRIVQEALTNAVKHAPGAEAEVIVRAGGGKLVIEVANDRTGAPPAAEGTGLLSMNERAAAVGGTLVAGPRGPRWRVRAHLPLGDRS